MPTGVVMTASVTAMVTTETATPTAVAEVDEGDDTELDGAIVALDGGLGSGRGRSSWQ